VMAVPGRNASRVIARDARLGRVTDWVDRGVDRMRTLLSRG